jgi:hypothetical protein
MRKLLIGLITLATGIYIQTDIVWGQQYENQPQQQERHLSPVVEQMLSQANGYEKTAAERYARGDKQGGDLSQLLADNMRQRAYQLQQMLEQMRRK